MARVLLAWELGAGQGHLRPLLSLAARLRAQGHAVWLAVRDVLRARAVLDTLPSPPCQLLAAPAFPGLQAVVDTPLSALSDVLWFESGGHTPAALRAHFLAWRALLGGLAADLLIADAAPVAMAAAAGVCPVIEYGGFFHMTDAAGWRIFRDWERIDRAAVERRAARLLESCNGARSDCALPAVDTLPRVFAAAARLQRGLAALDPYGLRPGVHYLGSPPDSGDSVRTWDWPTGSAFRARLFAYLRAGHPQQPRILAALAKFAETGAVVCVYEGLPASARPQQAHLYFVDGALNLDALWPTVQLCVCHGGSLTQRAVQAGKPVLAVPMQTEQFLLSRQLQASGAGQLALPLERPDVLAGIRTTLIDPRCQQTVSQIATAHAAAHPDPGALLDAAIADALAQ